MNDVECYYCGEKGHIQSMKLQEKRGKVKLEVEDD